MDMFKSSNVANFQKMEQTIVKNGEVEVTCEEKRFKGAWYRAILEENQSGHEMLSVRYSTLTEKVDQSLIRPVPPEDLFDGDFLKEGSVVDADRNGGFWTGVVIKKMENNKYLVYLDSESDIIQFEKRQLRAHYDWTGSKWVRPENKQLGRSVFSAGNIVEYRSGSGWVPAMVVREIENENRFLVKCCNNKSFSFSEESKTRSVESVRVRPMQPPYDVEEYGILDCVDALCGNAWCPGVVKKILKGGRYTISLGKAKNEAPFDHSDLRLPMEWKDSVWHKRAKLPKPETGTPSEIITTPVKHEKAKGKTSNEQKKNESIQDKMGEKPNSRKRKTKAEDLPFAKKSLWKTYETMEVPQFNPLFETREEDFREGFALGMMFSELSNKLKDVKTDVSISQLNILKDSCLELEKHGFNVTTYLSLIEELLALKEREGNISEKLKGFDKEMIDESIKKRKAEEEFDEIECKILELQRQQVVNKEKKEAVEKKICQIESCVQDLGVERKVVESEFETTLPSLYILLSGEKKK